MFKAIHDLVCQGQCQNKGQGLIAKEEIDKHFDLGPSHYVPRPEDAHLFEAGLIRTATGSYINHSDSPNCILIKNGNVFSLCTFANIKKDEELTINYTLYRCGDNYDMTKFVK